ncbi:hypothetical protein [Streptococcus pneumoniae]|uniref:hypothetical protein n=1 Tax=Streptococcus pneumoniae TaxID=1313 RepID=UPI0015C5DAFC|nr:hypothetical protein [Streptococcus pneumoniae]
MTESAINDRMNSDKKDLFLKQKMKRFKKEIKRQRQALSFLEKNETFQKRRLL